MLIPISAKHFRMWKCHRFSLSLPAAPHRKDLPCTQGKEPFVLLWVRVLSVFSFLHISYLIKRVAEELHLLFSFQCKRKNCFPPQSFLNLINASFAYQITVQFQIIICSSISYISIFVFCHNFPIPHLSKLNQQLGVFLFGVTWGLFTTTQIIYLFVWQMVRFFFSHIIFIVLFSSSLPCLLNASVH